MLFFRGAWKTNPVCYEQLRERLERLIEEEEKRRKQSADYFNSSSQYADIYKAALNEKEQRNNLGFTLFEFAVYEELESIKKNQELSKATTKKIFSKLSEETKLIGWKTKRSSEKKMSVDIYDILLVSGYPDNKIEEVTQMIIDMDGEFVADITNSDVNENAKSQARELYEGWLRRIAYPILETKTKIYALKLGANVQNISIKSSSKSRWASLTKTDSINFNMHLMKAPQEVIDYIILHEVCHLKVKGHSHHYWDLVYRYMPDYQEKINWLNVNGKVLIGSDKITSEPQYQCQCDK